MEREKPGRSGGGKILFFVIFATGLLVLLLYLVRFDKVTVTGTEHVDREDALQMILPEEERRLSSVLFKMVMGPRSNDLFEKISIRITGLKSVRITVKEIPSDCVLEEEHGYSVVNEKGVVTEFCDSCPEELTILWGFSARGTARYEKVPAWNDELFTDALALAERVRAYGIPCERVYCSLRDYIFVTGKITVMLGGTEYTDEKFKTFLDLYPSLIGLSGTLHLDNYDPGSEDGKYTFEVVK